MKGSNFHLPPPVSISFFVLLTIASDVRKSTRIMNKRLTLFHNTIVIGYSYKRNILLLLLLLQLRIVVVSSFFPPTRLSSLSLQQQQRQPLFVPTVERTLLHVLRLKGGEINNSPNPKYQHVSLQLRQHRRHRQRQQLYCTKTSQVDDGMESEVVVDVVEMDVDEDTQVSNVVGQPEYSISSINLSRRWLQLVQDGKVSATVQIPYDDETDHNDDDSPPVMASVRYGVRVMTRNSITKCEEFVIQQQHVDDEENSNRQHDLVKQINTTLANLQEESQDEDEQSSSSTVKYRVDEYGFVAQLQLVRTLRPPPSPGFATSTTSQPPKYDETTDSFVTGPLRLQLRPLVGTLSMKDGATNKNTINTPWDVYHNVSPADSRGHFLIIPSLSTNYKDNNWRGQLFTKEDCHDVVQLTSTIDPIGSIFVGYNSVGAGASQNHIHCHMWPCPPIPLLDRVSKSATSNEDDEDDDGNYYDRDEVDDHAHGHSHNHDHTHSHEHSFDCDESGEAKNIEKMQNNGWDCYPVTKVNEIYDIHDIYDDDNEEVDEGGDDEPSAVVEVSYLKYPVFCVQLSAKRKHLTRLGQALATILDSIGSAPYNIGFLNRPVSLDENDDVAVDVYVFVRSKERSDVLPSLKLGVSEMMGIFHAQSDAELELLVPTAESSQNDDHKEYDAPPMVRALQDISYQDEAELWETIKTNLSKLKGT